MDERETVLDILLDIDRNKAFSNIAIGKALKKYQFEDKQKRAFVTRLAEGVTEMRIQLDFILDGVTKIKTSGMKPLVRNALRMGVYQLLYMDSVPDRAAIFETVKLVKKRGFNSLSGFTNAVLRNIERDKDGIKKRVDEVPCIKYSVPEWLYGFLREIYGDEMAEKILDFSSSNRPTVIRVNREKTDKETLRQLLEEKGIDVKDGYYSENALLIDGYDFIKRIPGFREGYFSIQDESSQAAVKAAFDTYNDRHYETEGNDIGTVTVYDLCAAPGGKTTYMAELCSDKTPGMTGNIYSYDISKDKTELILENVERLGLLNVNVAVSDATVLHEDMTDKADIVIADVPCSGLGIMGRKNDIKYRVKPDDFRTLREMADTILDNSVSYLKRGGVLLFSTCTINPYENGEAAEALILRHPELKKIEERTFLQGIDKCDGFYYSVMTKES
ncbi:MAG: 16S rRNA (cytosine(967)-C(5))-methyltransferase RsmB [Eubacterium sp.]|nr:16S rRNA (cytosine(967)-C(5))-methyltransferase RsmB [Eubacterium sp.]